MSKTPTNSERYIRATEVFPYDVRRIGLTEMDEASLARTFNRLAQLCHYDQLSGKDKEDCLLLLTTCRNEWYTLNAMYAEADQWCKEGSKYTGFGDALNVLRQAISRSLSLEKAGKKAATILETSAHYLEEYDKKQDLFFNRFEKVRSNLLLFADSIKDLHARKEFIKYYAEKDSGPGPDHVLSPILVAGYEIYRQRLIHWYEVARPLTGLVRTYISEVLEIGESHIKTCSNYLEELSKSLQLWRVPYGYVCPDNPLGEIFSWRRSTLRSSDIVTGMNNLQQFISYCDNICQTSRLFLQEMLPSKPKGEGQFLLRKPGEREPISIGGKMFDLRHEMFVIIMDMRNSSGERYRSPELKVKITNIIESLCQDEEAVSEYTYNDCRAVGCTFLGKGIRSIARLWHALEAERSPSGFAGLRMGAVCGSMLVGWQGEWCNDRILMDCNNTLSAAARIMDLDKLRWKIDTIEGQSLKSNLGDWSIDESLIFFDTSLYEKLPNEIQERCREVNVIKLRSIGGRLCWAIPIPTLAETLT